MKYLFYSLILLLTVISSSLYAEVKLPSIFSDNMVLQQGIPVRVWGLADAGENVIVTFLNQKKTTITDEQGKWSLFLDTLAYGGPFELIVSGKNTIKYSNVMVGEVWLCSGQSNMEWPVSLSQDAAQEILKSIYPKVRLFKVRRNAKSQPEEDVTGNWDNCEPVYVSGFSAVAYYFGTELYMNLDVPIGLIDASWGGSAAEAWIDIDVLKSRIEFNPLIKKWEDCLEKFVSMEHIMDTINSYYMSVHNWLKATEFASKNKTTLPQPPIIPECLECSTPLGGMYNGMIAPINPFSIRGVIWYQGESNADHEDYELLFPTLIENWRTARDQGDFPFLFVQIAPFGSFYKKDNAARLREAQLMTYQNVCNTGMVVTMDIGDVNDIHPRNKKEVGRRLALWALADTYRQKGIVKSGPIYKSMSVEGNKVKIHFDYTGGGLIAQNMDSLGFEISGKDQVFIPASCDIMGDHVLVYAESIKKPVAVRYGWGNAPRACLFNKEGLPASPFRTGQ